MIEIPSYLGDLQKEAVKAVGFYYDLGNQKLGMALPYPKISFDLSGTTAGVAYPYKNFIKLNKTFLARNTEDFLKVVTGHEAAHCFTHHKYKGQETPHGKGWQRIMWTLGLQAKRCHNYLAESRGAEPIVHRTHEGLVSVAGGIRTIQVEL